MALGKLRGPMSANQPPSRDVAITASTNPVTGVEQLVIEYADGSQQVHEGAWSEGREMAHRAGLDQREDEPVGVTRWSRRAI
jgi:hypothetical protein